MGEVQQLQRRCVPGNDTDLKKVLQKAEPFCSWSGFTISGAQDTKFNGRYSRRDASESPDWYVDEPEHNGLQWHERFDDPASPWYSKHGDPDVFMLRLPYRGGEWRILDAMTILDANVMSGVHQNKQYISQYTDPDSVEPPTDGRWYCEKYRTYDDSL